MFKELLWMVDNEVGLKWINIKIPFLQLHSLCLKPIWGMALYAIALFLLFCVSNFTILLIKLCFNFFCIIHVALFNISLLCMVDLCLGLFLLYFVPTNLVHVNNSLVVIKKIHFNIHKLFKFELIPFYVNP